MKLGGEGDGGEPERIWEREKNMIKIQRMETF